VSDPGGGAGRLETEMRLRPSRLPVMRLSRKALLGLGIVAATGIAAALLFALEPHRATTGSELYNLSNAPPPEGLASLPRDYTGLPRTVPKRSAARNLFGHSKILMPPLPRPSVPCVTR
jgi:hypothetical protein